MCPTSRGCTPSKESGTTPVAGPHEKVDFAGKRVAVIGTGSSGVQSIPVIAEQAGRLTVFQRTPQYTIPARHATVDRKFLEEVVKPNYGEILEKARWSAGGFPVDRDERSALEVTEAERLETYEAGWAEGGIRFLAGSFKDIATDRRANDTMAEFIRKKIREMVKDPETVEKTASYRPSVWCKTCPHRYRLL